MAEPFTLWQTPTKTEDEKEFQAFKKWFGNQYGAAALHPLGGFASVGLTVQGFRNLPQYQLWLNLDMPSFKVSTENLQKAYYKTLTPMPPEWQTQPWLGQSTTDWEYPGSPAFQKWWGKQTPPTPTAPQGIDQTVMGLLGAGGGESAYSFPPPEPYPIVDGYTQYPEGAGPEVENLPGATSAWGTPGADLTPQAGAGGAINYYSPTPAGGRGDMEWKFQPPNEFGEGGGYYQIPKEGMSAWQQAQMGMQQEQSQFAQQQASWAAVARMNEQQAAQSQFEQQMAQQAAATKRQQDIEQQATLAKMAAEPQSWLQYNAAAGTVPTIQPWMVPLMQQSYTVQAPGYATSPEYGSYTYGKQGESSFMSPLQAGQPIPGYSAVPFTNDEGYTRWAAPYMSEPGGLMIQGKQPLSGGGYMSNIGAQSRPGGVPDYTQLPWLQTPTRAYWEGMGPTGRSQSLAYEQARTGATPKETQWRLPWEQVKRALPSGGGMNLTYRR